MADKTTGGLPAVQESPIGGLPGILELYRDSRIPVEQQGEARHMTGGQFAEFARESAKQDVQRAVDAADRAEEAAESVGAAVEDAQEAAAAAQTDRQGAESAQAAAEQAKDTAVRKAGEASGSAQLSQSWAAGGTGVREGEETNNSMYWANRAQAYAEQASTPAVQGVYNFVLTDRDTGERYALLVESGTLKLLGVPDTMDAADMALIDTVTGTKQQLIVESGTLKLLEVE